MIRRKSPQQYIPSIAKFVAPLGLLLGIIWGIAIATRFGPLQGLLMGLLLGGLFAAGLSGWLAWSASRRKPLGSVQDAEGLFSWRYVDVSAPRNQVFDTGVTILKILCRSQPDLQDETRGVLICETQSSWLTWGLKSAYGWNPWMSTLPGCRY